MLFTIVALYIAFSEKREQAYYSNLNFAIWYKITLNTALVLQKIA